LLRSLCLCSLKSSSLKMARRACWERTAMRLFRQDCAATRLKFTRYLYCNVFVGLSSIIH
jgi:hypothetical protein